MTTQTATEERPTTRAATCTIAVEGYRLLVRWDAPDWQSWQEMFADWKRTLGRHCDAVWRERDKCWSVPLSRRAVVCEWAETWCVGGAREDGVA